LITTTAAFKEDLRALTHEKNKRRNKSFPDFASNIQICSEWLRKDTASIHITTTKCKKYLSQNNESSVCSKDLGMVAWVVKLNNFVY